MIHVSLGNGWYNLESNDNGKWRWTGKDWMDPSLYINVTKNEGQAIIMDLNYSSIQKSNQFSIYLDNKQIKLCQDPIYCKTDRIFLEKGEHEVIFKPRLPPIIPTGESRSLDYAYGLINLSIIQ
jgi:hypothetical protein